MGEAVGEAQENLDEHTVQAFASDLGNNLRAI